MRVVGDDVEYVGRHGPYCGDCFDRGITVSVPVKASYKQGHKTFWSRQDVEEFLTEAWIEHAT